MSLRILQLALATAVCMTTHQDLISLHPLSSPATIPHPSVLTYPTCPASNHSILPPPSQSAHNHNHIHIHNLNLNLKHSHSLSNCPSSPQTQINSIPRLLSFNEWIAKDKSFTKRSFKHQILQNHLSSNSNSISLSKSNPNPNPNSFSNSHSHSNHLIPLHPNLFSSHPNILNLHPHLDHNHFQLHSGPDLPTCDSNHPIPSQPFPHHPISHYEPNNSSHSLPQPSPEPVLLPHPHTGTGSTEDPLKILCARTNYASFDCSASIHRSSKHSKSASAILNEKKDKYMLTPCQPKQLQLQNSHSPIPNEPANFVVFELCDEIEIDHVVLANFEFFSSMFKLIRFSVSSSGLEGASGADWLNVGLFRTRNVRGLQVFPIRNLKGFYRYVRLDFLSHYGSEYYCPLSLVRIYGLTQIDAYRRDQELERRQVEQQDEDEAQYEHEDQLSIQADEQAAAGLNPNHTHRPPRDPPPAPQTHPPSDPSRLTSDHAAEAPPESTHSPPEPPTQRPLPDDGPLTHPSSADPPGPHKPSPDHSGPPVDSSHPPPIPDSHSDDSKQSQQQPQDGLQSRSHHPQPIPNQADAAGPPFEPTLSAQKEPAQSHQEAQDFSGSTEPGREDVPPAEPPSNGLPPTGPVSSTPPAAAAPPAEAGIREGKKGSPEANDPPRASSAPKAPLTDKSGPGANGGAQASESIFGQIMKRLQNLETNHELGLKYVEEQAKVLEQSVLRLDGRLGGLDEQTRLHLQTDSKRDRLMRRLELQLELERRLYEHRLGTLEGQVAFVNRVGLAQFLSTIVVLLILGLTRFQQQQPGPTGRRLPESTTRRVAVTRMSPRVKTGGTGGGPKEGIGSSQMRRPTPTSRLSHAAQGRSPLKKPTSLGSTGGRGKGVEETRMASGQLGMGGNKPERLLFGGPLRAMEGIPQGILAAPTMGGTSKLALPGDVGKRHARSESANSQWMTECSNAGSGEESDVLVMGISRSRSSGGGGGRAREVIGGGGVVSVVVTDEGVTVGGGQDAMRVEWKMPSETMTDGKRVLGKVYDESCDQVGTRCITGEASGVKQETVGGGEAALPVLRGIGFEQGLGGCAWKGNGDEQRVNGYIDGRISNSSPNSSSSSGQGTTTAIGSGESKGGESCGSSGVQSKNNPVDNQDGERGIKNSQSFKLLGQGEDCGDDGEGGGEKKSRLKSLDSIVPIITSSSSKACSVSEDLVVVVDNGGECVDDDDGLGIGLSVGLISLPPSYRSAVNGSSSSSGGGGSGSNTVGGNTVGGSSSSVSDQDVVV